MPGGRSRFPAIPVTAHSIPDSRSDSRTAAWAKDSPGPATPPGTPYQQDLACVVDYDHFGGGDEAAGPRRLGEVAASDLEAGAIVTTARDRIRIRSLPILSVG